MENAMTGSEGRAEWREKEKERVGEIWKPEKEVTTRGKKVRKEKKK